MYITRYFWGYVFLLGLVACSHSQQASQIHIQNETTETATLTNETTEQPSLVSPTKRPTPTSTVRAAKEPVLVDQLPLDEPWISGNSSTCHVDQSPHNEPPISGGVGICHIGKNYIMSVSNTGALQKLRVPVEKVIERQTKPPLLIAYSTEETFILIDTENWQHMPLNVSSDISVQGALLSPDETQLVFNNSPRQQQNGQREQSLQVMNIQTGETYVIESSELSDNELPLDRIRPIGWRDHILYARMQTSATSVFWRIDLAQAPRDIRKEKVIGSTGIWGFSPSGNAFVWDDAYDDPPPRLRNLVTGDETYLNDTQRVTFSPDGHFLASIRASADEQDLEFVLYDLIQPDFVTQAPIQRVDLPEGTKLGELQWEGDGHYILVSYRNVL
ncbi:MAG: hypothetical protein AAGF95_32675, partial [Chloroflexota bacterium]